jgi:hypothetical protein
MKHPTKQIGAKTHFYCKFVHSFDYYILIFYVIYFIHFIERMWGFFTNCIVDMDNIMFLFKEVTGINLR